MVTSAKDGTWCNHKNLTLLNNPNPLLSKAHLTTLNLSHFKMVEAMGLKIITSRFPWMALPPYQISWKSTKQFKDIHRSFIPKATNSFRLFLPYSKLALVSMVTFLCRFCSTVNYMPWLPLLHQLKIVCDVPMVTQQCRQFQTIAEQGWKLCIQLTNLNLNHFKMVEARD
jgi:hypothetical protein